MQQMIQARARRAVCPVELFLGVGARVGGRHGRLTTCRVPSQFNELTAAELHGRSPASQDNCILRPLWSPADRCVALFKILRADYLNDGWVKMCGDQYPA